MIFTKFTIIIPTKNRSNTLKYCIESCLNQDYPNYQIIVNDNNSSDDTKKVVESFKDSRLIYRNTGLSLSMSENWENSLSAVSDGFISFIGDDDGLMPNALKVANSHILKYGVKAIIGRRDLYKWNNVAEIKQRGILRYEVRRKTQMLEFQKVLHEVVFKTRDYAKLPCIYSIGFISMEIINTIKIKSSGIFFQSSIPDIYSAIVIGASVKEYLYVNYSFFLGGISSYSHGNSASDPNANKEIIKDFISANNIPFHHKLVFNSTMSISICESIYRANDIGLVDFKLDIIQVAEICMNEAVNMKYLESYNLVKDSIMRTLLINGVDKAYATSFLDKFKYNSKFRRYFYLGLALLNDKNKLNIINLRKKVSNINDACQLNYKLNKDSYYKNNLLCLFVSFVWNLILAPSKKN